MSSLLKTAVLALTGWILIVPPIARADVIQSETGGFRWVTGGPTGAVQAETTGRSASVEDPAYTEAVAMAGPYAWQEYIAVLAAKYDISPALLEAVVWQESRWRSGLTSRAGAQGLAQLMPGTAQQLGVAIADPHANLEGGARYLRMQLDAFGGDVEKALAAYNAGPGRVQSAGGVPRIPETQAYVAAIMARLTGRVRR